MAVNSSLYVNGTLVQEVIVGTTDVTKVICNGVTVYEKTGTPIADDATIIKMIQAGKLFIAFVYRDPDNDELNELVHVFTGMSSNYNQWVEDYDEDIANVIKQFLCLIAPRDGDAEKLEQVERFISQMISDGTLEQYVQTLAEIITEGVSVGIAFENMSEYLYGREDALAIRTEILTYIADALGIPVEQLQNGEW